MLSAGQDAPAALDESVCSDHEDGQLVVGMLYAKPGTVLETAVQSQILSLICGAGTGSTIHVGAHYVADHEMREALVEKHAEDGVEIQVIVDGGAAEGGDNYKEYGELADELGSDRNQSSWIDHCRGSTRACIGGGKDDYADALMHNKFLLFSETHGAKDVVLQTSHNFRFGGSGTGMWNTSYTVADDSQVYEHYRGYFDDLAAADPKVNDYYTSNDLAQPDSPKYQIFHSPSAGKQNPIYDQLDKIDCTKKNDTGGTKDHRTVVRVAVWMISGDEWDDPGTYLARKLNHMDDEGCYVDVVVDTIDTAKGSKDGPLEALLRKPKGKYNGPEVREFYGKKNGLHSKDILVDGNFDGEANQKVVLTGTHNFTWKSARVNDETTLVIKDAKAYADYSEFFIDARKTASLTWQTSKYKR